MPPADARLKRDIENPVKLVITLKYRARYGIHDPCRIVLGMKFSCDLENATSHDRTSRAFYFRKRAFLSRDLVT